MCVWVWVLQSTCANFRTPVRKRPHLGAQEHVFVQPPKRPQAVRSAHAIVNATLAGSKRLLRAVISV